MNKYLIITIICLLFTSVSCKDDVNKEDDFLEYLPGTEGGLGDNNPYWAWVKNFPGWIDITVQRETSVSVVVDARYKKVDVDSRIGFKETPWFSTGMYAAPGEPVEIIIPASLKGKVDWQIGAWRCELPSTLVLKRYNKVFETETLNSETNKISSWFGGHIYLVPKEPLDALVTLEIKGAVKSPDFILGETDPAEWMNRVISTKVPFGELRGKNCIWTMPKSLLAKIKNPKELVEFYDDVIEKDFNGFHGLSTNAAEAKNRSLSFPVRVVQDIQLESGASHPGYPIVLELSDTIIGTNLADMMSTNVALKFYQEVGKNFRTWCWTWVDGAGDFSNQAALLPYYYSRIRVAKGFPDGGTTDWAIALDEYILNNKSTTKNFDTDVKLDKNNARLIPMIQLAQKYGWGLFAYLGQTSRDLNESDAIVLKLLKSTARRDFFCKRVCEYANADLTPFFDAWGIKYSNYTKTDMQRLPLYTGDKFWEKWDRSIIPSNEPRTPSSIKLADNNYNNVPSMLNQTSWKIYDVFTALGAQENTVECIIDGRQAENLSKAPGGTHWGTPGSMARPIFNPQPWVCIDMRSTINVSDVHIWYRNNTSLHLHPNKFKVEGKLNENDAWIPIGGDFAMGAWNANLLKKWNSFAIPTVVPARYLRLTLISAFPKNATNYTEQGNTSLEEFTISGTINIGGSIGNADPKDDSDFPIYK